MTDIVTLTINPSIDISTSIDRVVPVRKLRCSAAQRYPGGGGVNVARVVARLGADVKALYGYARPSMACAAAAHQARECSRRWRQLFRRCGLEPRVRPQYGGGVSIWRGRGFGCATCTGDRVLPPRRCPTSLSSGHDRSHLRSAPCANAPDTIGAYEHSRRYPFLTGRSANVAQPPTPGQRAFVGDCAIFQKVAWRSLAKIDHFQSRRTCIQFRRSAKTSHWRQSQMCWKSTASNASR